MKRADTTSTQKAQNGATTSVAEQREKTGPTELMCKILVVGDIGAGKTSIIQRYVNNIFSTQYKSTIGVDFALKVIQINQSTIVRLQLWDIAGQERFGNMTRVYYRSAVGAFVVFDVITRANMEAVQKWKKDIDAKVTLPDGSPIPVILLANKCDLLREGAGPDISDMDKYCVEQGFVGWEKTSAKENMHIEKGMRMLIDTVLERTAGIQPQPEKSTLELNPDKEPHINTCTC